MKITITIKKDDEGYLLEGVLIKLRGIAKVELGETKYRFVVTITTTDADEEAVATLLGKLEYDGDIHIRNKAAFEKKYAHLW